MTDLLFLLLIPLAPVWVLAFRSYRASRSVRAAFDDPDGQMRFEWPDADSREFQRPAFRTVVADVKVAGFERLGARIEFIGSLRIPTVQYLSADQTVRASVWSHRNMLGMPVPMMSLYSAGADGRQYLTNSTGAGAGPRISALTARGDFQRRLQIHLHSHDYRSPRIELDRDTIDKLDRDQMRYTDWGLYEQKLRGA